MGLKQSKENNIEDSDNYEEPHMKCNTTCYSNNISNYVRMVYIITALIWIGIIIVFQLYYTDIIGWLLLSIPLIVYAFGFCNANCLCREVEDYLFNSNYLAIGLIVILPLMSWISRDYNGRSIEDAKRFKSILVVSIILILISMLDIWISRNWLSVYKHAKSAIQTLAIGLLIYGFYQYYLMCDQHYLLKV